MQSFTVRPPRKGRQRQACPHSGYARNEGVPTLKSLIRIKGCLSVYGTQRASAKQITAPVMGEGENCAGGLRQLKRTVIVTSVATDGRGTVHHTGA